MAIHARAQSLRVIKLDFVFPRIRQFGMAGLTGVRGGEPPVVFAGLAARVDFVVAREAIVDQQGVINTGRDPARHFMAGVAVLGCRDMGWLGSLAGCDHVVVANDATARQIHLRVIHFDIRLFPGLHADVAGLADIGRLNMRGILWCGVDTWPVAQRAIVGDVEFLVRKRVRQPCGGGMAQIAGFQRWNMRRGLRGCADVGDDNTAQLEVMTVETLAHQHLLVGHRIH